MFSILFIACVLQAATSSADAAKPLPDLTAFLQGVRKHLHSDRALLSRYTYIERTTLRELDSGGKVKKTELREYEVYPGLDEKSTYRKLISKDGKPVSADELEKRERAYEKKVLEEQRKRDRESPEDRRRREAKEAESKRKEEESLDEAFRIYNTTLIGREQFEGRPAIVLLFEPRPGYQPKTLDAKVMAKIRGRAWFGESDQELIRIDAELGDNLSLGLGLVAKLNRGTRMVFQRRRVNDEIWLPAQSHFAGTGRILVLKGFRIDVETAYSDYKKFSVETSVNIEGRKKP